MPRTKRKSKQATMKDEHQIFEGAAKIYRNEASGDVWQFRMWVSEEQKYVRRTLKTRDRESAIELARTMYLEIYSDIKTGRKIFGITIGELVEKYIEWRKEDAAIGNITHERVSTIRSHLSHLFEIKDKRLKVSELERTSLYDYANFRKLTNPTVRDSTIVNEQSTINHLMKFGFRKGLTHFETFDFRKRKVDRDAVIRRDTFSLDEYDKLVNYMRQYASKKASKSDEVCNERLLIRDCILIASNTMLRVGELWQLRWGDIQSIEQIGDDDGSKMTLVTIWVRAEISKTRRSRKVISRGGDYFMRLRKRSGEVSDDDYVFGPISGSSRSANVKRYGHWKAIMAGLGIDYKKRNLTWYSLRHFGITCRIRAGVNLSEIAKIAGTSTTYIESHYGHIDDQMLKSAALKNFKITKDGLRITTSTH